MNNGLAPKVANPPYTFALLYPLALLPVRMGIFVYSLIAVFAIYGTHRLTQINKWLLLLSYPTIRNLFFAQLEPITTLGVALGWWAVQGKRPILLGLAITLLGIKPQVTSMIGLVYAVWGWHIKILVIPVSALLYSLVLYGWWIPEWIELLLNQSVGSSSFFQGGLGAFPWGLLAWLPLMIGYRYYSKKEAAGAVIAANILSVPYVGPYSVMAFLGLPTSWFTYLFVLPLNFWLDMRLALILVILFPLIRYFGQTHRRWFRPEP